MRRTTYTAILLLLISDLAFSATWVKDMILPGKVRDFKEYQNCPPGNSNCTLISGGHRDFNYYLGYGCKGAVETKIDASGQSTAFPDDNRNPKFKSPNPCLGTHFTGETEFDPWYKDYDIAMNRPFLVPLRFSFYDDCIMRFNDSAFFPINNGKEMYTLRGPQYTNSDAGCGTFGHLQTSFPDSNWGFTLEFHTVFTYYQGQHQIFDFTGDDDVWVFINDSLVIDLGGVHSAQHASLDLDNLQAGFLQNGHEYKFDFFSAERHANESNIKIWTSILFNSETGSDSVFCNGQWQKIGTPSWPPSWYTAWKNPRISGFLTGLDQLDGLEGSIVTFSGIGTDTAGYFGNYEMRVPAGWTGTVTPIKTGYSFTPPSRQFTTLLASQANVNFQGTDTAKPVVRLSSPNGGENWIAGSTQKIAWDSATDNSVIETRYIYWRKNSQAWQLVDSASSNGTKGDWSWVLPQDTCDLCWVKIEFADKTGNKGLDSSNAPFRIQFAPHFTSPDTAAVTVGTLMQYPIAYQNPIGGGSPSFALIPGGPSWIILTGGGTILAGIPPAGNGVDTVRVEMKVNGTPYDTLELVIRRSDPNATIERIGVARASFGLRSIGTGSANLSFLADLPKTGTYRVALTDITGRTIWKSSLAAPQPGSYRFQLNGAYAQMLGNSGIVFVALEGMGNRTVLRHLSVK